MAIGRPVTVAGVNNQAGGLAIQWQQIAASTLLFTGPLAALTPSPHDGLVAIGFTSGDATNMVASALLLSSLAGVYYGTAAQTPAYDFDANLASLRGFGLG